MVVSLLNDLGVSEIVGTIMLLGVTVGLFSVVAGVVLSFPSSESAPLADIVGTVVDGEVIILNRGGEPVSLDSRVLVDVDGNISRYSVGELLDPDFAADGWWDIGENIRFDIVDLCGPGSSAETVGLTIIDGKSSQIIFKGFF